MRDLRGERKLRVERRENFDGWERERERWMWEKETLDDKSILIIKNNTSI